MDKVYEHQKVEDKIYEAWEKGGYFKPEINKEAFDSGSYDDKFTIVLPPPNANGDLHFGHAMFTVEDILIRYNRMKGKAALWLPGTDHAGFETQFVFEKQLQKDGKSRFDYSREELYQMIWDFVTSSGGKIESQLRKLGFSLDWSRQKFTLDPDIIKLVYKTFYQMHEEGLIYRGKRLVNYCVRDGTSFSDLEVNHEEREDTIWYINYPVVGSEESVTVATTRPETMFGDTAVAVNPQDARYEQLVGKKLKLPLTDREIPLIADESVDMNFGTGAVKVTPGHDPADFDRGIKHELDQITVIGFDGKMTKEAGKYEGLFFTKARPQVLEDLTAGGYVVKEEKIVHQVPTCYKCKTVIQPLLMQQWFVKVDSLRNAAIEAIKKGEVQIVPANFESQLFQWLENLRDWNISRQIVWGIRIPAWRNTKTDEWVVTEGDAPEGDDWEQDTDTFDTWFSSGQWPVVTLKTSKPGDFEKFYPTSVMETAYDILRAWVSRMIMLGIYTTNEVPFETVLFHGIVNDPYGKKMSKSKGNVVNPLELIEQYGADGVRFALVYGNSTGNDQALSYPKLDAARKFTNKLWNMARFIQLQEEKAYSSNRERSSHDVRTINPEHDNDKEWVKKVDQLSADVTRYLDSYQFNLAAETLYEFIWHQFADVYIEDVKNRIDENSFTVLRSLFTVQLKLLHPFMPFVTEELYGQLKLGNKMLIIEQWPQ